jgi:MFS family permease
MLQNLRSVMDRYPRQFWLLLAGNLVSATGGAMIWPFLSIYLRQRLDLPLATIASLLTLNAVMGILSSFIAGSAADRIGRKRIMAVSLCAGVIYYLLMSQAETLLAYAILMGLWGAFNPLFSVGANTMIADLIPSEQRMDAYSLTRVVHNVGIAIGPIAGGFLAVVSYTYAFYAAAFAFAVFAILVIFFIRDTLPEVDADQTMQPVKAGYGHVLRDTTFISFTLLFALTTMAASIMFILLPVYAKENFGLAENRYSYIVTVNATMCIFLQYYVTRIAKRFPTLPVIGIGALFYAIGVGSVALGAGFWAFVISMVIMTVGELVLTPAATNMVANLAPVNMRGRYMSIYGLGWPIASGVGPILGGFLSDTIAPVAMWYGGGMLGLLGAAGFFILARMTRTVKTETANVGV